MMYAALATHAALIASVVMLAGTPATPVAPDRAPVPALGAASATPAKAPLRCRLYFGCAPVAPAAPSQN